MSGKKKLIDLYAYRRKNDQLLFLLLKRAEKKIYSGQWRMIGGKVKTEELHWQAAIRELKEETKLTPVRFWSVPTLNHFYEPQTDQIHLIPAFAAEVPNDSSVKLDDEHKMYKWVTIDEITSYIFWPEQVRIFHMIQEFVINDKILPDWIIDTDFT
jgi:dihydroneopterin triphosphate diphosphatase